MRAPMVRLARPDLGDADLDAMGCAELRALAKGLRVFSDRSGGEEFPLYERDDGAVVYGGGGGVGGAACSRRPRAHGPCRLASLHSSTGFVAQSPTSASVEITTTASVILTSNEMGRRLSRQLQEQHPPSAIARDADARRRDVGTALNFLT